MDAEGAAVLVEAKANIPEVISSATRAGPDSKERIDSALKEVADHLGA